MSRVETNRSIAYLVGLESKHTPNHFHLHSIDKPLTHVDDLKFDISGEWLMPVVAKCTEIASESGMMADICSEWYDIFDEEVSWAFLEGKIDVVYAAVVEFVNLINSQKPV